MMKSERAHPPGSRLVQLMASLGVSVLLSLAAGPVQVQGPARPNILVIWGDDIGYWNTSAYHRRMRWATRRRTSTGWPGKA
jgi:hypothetical protein